MRLSRYFYILRCSDSSYYTGVTIDLEKRLYEHEHSKNQEAYTFDKQELSVCNNATLHLNYEKNRTPFDSAQGDSTTGFVISSAVGKGKAKLDVELRHLTLRLTP